MRSRRFSRAWRPFGRPPSLYYGFSILPENHPSLCIPVWGCIPASVKMLPPLLATTYHYWLRNQTVVACLCFGPVFQFLGLIKTRAFLRAWGARSLRAWGARFLRAWGVRFLRPWCGERFFQARPAGLVFVRFVLEMCLVPAAHVLAPVWFMVKIVLQYRCPGRRPRVCFSPAP